jgi:hypothetical protein
VMVRPVAWLGVVLAAFAAVAWAQGPEDLAQSTAEAWLKLVDEGKYDAAWEQSARLFRGAVTKEQWRQAASGTRKPLGKLRSRAVKSRQSTTTLPGAPDGKYVVIQYEAVFEGKATAVETITPMLDARRRMAGVGLLHPVAD